MKRILAFGDSNTWGFDPATHDRYSEEIRWTSLLQKTLGNDAVIIEEGLNGRTTAFDDPGWDGRNGLASLPSILEADRPLDAAIIMLGTNDCKSVFHASTEEITTGLEQCLTKILDYVSAKNILLISPLFLGEIALRRGSYSDQSMAVSRELKQTYKELANQYGTSHLAASDVAKASSIDGEHLTKEGHHALYEAILKAITPIIGITEE
jgi:lysophospholipase L1-like esterase